MKLTVFKDRIHAGQELAEALVKYAGRNDAIVLGLPRGGVPVAYEVAKKLGAPLDVLVVRKLGVPGYEEFAMGAIASGGGSSSARSQTDHHRRSCCGTGCLRHAEAHGRWIDRHSHTG